MSELGLQARVHGVLQSLPDAMADAAAQSAAAAALFALAKECLHKARSDLATLLLEPLVAREPESARAWQALAFAYRDEQRMPEAESAFARATDLAPDDALGWLARSQTRFVSGMPAADFARRALELAPEDRTVIGSCANVLVGEGQRGAAENLLVQALARWPDWLEGQKSLATLRYLAGDHEEFARGYAAASRALPQHLQLRLAWFRAVAQARNWAAAARIIDEGEQLFGPQPAFALARVFMASESGDFARAESLFGQTADIRDEVRDIAFIRHCLRTGQSARALEPALRLTQTASARLAWPYLSLIWRLTGDARAAWLDGEPPFVRIHDLEFAPGELEELASLLRGLHTSRSPYLEQSVRGGTQTDRPLFFRHEPLVVALRAKVLAALRDYVAALPPHVAGHPLLGTPRGQLLFAGSWSVRLQGEGFHVSHTHPQGWISSACYIALPPKQQLGAPPAGWIEFGTPPPELGLTLTPTARVEPKPGRLVLFPSTMWHATVPFGEGERMTVAFDVRVPGY